MGAQTSVAQRLLKSGPTVFSADAASTAYGNDGNDTLISNGADTMFGGSGDDLLYASTGNAATFFGDDGSDTLVGRTSSDAFFGGAGTDILMGNGGNDYLYGGNGTDYYDFRNDIQPGVFDYISDFNTGGGADAIMIPAAFQSATIFYQYGAATLVITNLGSSAWVGYVDNASVTQVQAQTAFL